jgi:hypothetical protein
LIRMSARHPVELGKEVGKGEMDTVVDAEKLELPPSPYEKKEMPDNKILATGLGRCKPGRVKVQLMIQRIAWFYGIREPRFCWLTHQCGKEADSKAAPLLFRFQKLGQGTTKNQKYSI